MNLIWSSYESSLLLVLPWIVGAPHRITLYERGGCQATSDWNCKLQTWCKIWRKSLLSQLGQLVQRKSKRITISVPVPVPQKLLSGEVSFQKVLRTSRRPCFEVSSLPCSTVSAIGSPSSIDLISALLVSMAIDLKNGNRHPPLPPRCASHECY